MLDNQPEPGDRDMASVTAVRPVGLSKRRDVDNWFIEPVTRAWFQAYVESGATTKEFAIPGTRVRASWAGDCARSLAYHVAGVEETDPATVADCWRFNVGTLVHEHIQAAVMAAFPGSQSEVKVSIGEDGSGHMDMLIIKPDGSRVSAEIKSINGTGFRRMMSPNGEGMRIKYLLQGALNAAAMDPVPDELLIAVFSLECMSPGEARKAGVTDEYNRFAGQWSYSPEVFLPIAERELKRMNRVIELVDEGPQGYLNVPRLIPDPELPRHEVVNPAKGTIETKDRDNRSTGLGWVWQCTYCPFQTQCTEDKEAGN